MFLIRLKSAKMECNFIVQNSLLIPPTFFIMPRTNTGITTHEYEGEIFPFD